jgi:hypothetical protein
LMTASRHFLNSDPDRFVFVHCRLSDGNHRTPSRDPSVAAVNE